MRRVSPFDARAYYYYYGGAAGGSRRFGAVGGTFSPISLSPAGFWEPPFLLFEEEDGTGTITATEAVGYMGDRSGNGKHVVQATSGMRPTYQTSGSIHYLLGDGTDDVLSLDFTEIAQPFEIVAALRLVAAAGTENMVGGGVTNNNGAIFSASGTVSLFAGATLSGPSVTDDTDFVVTARFNGASSRVRVDAGSYSEGDAGSSGMTGISFGNGPGGAGASNLRVYGAALLSGLQTDAALSQLLTYFAARQGRVL